MGLFNWLKKDPEIKKAEFVSPATGKIIPIEQVEDETLLLKFWEMVLLWNLQMAK